MVIRALTSPDPGSRCRMIEALQSAMRFTDQPIEFRSCENTLDLLDLNGSCQVGDLTVLTLGYEQMEELTSLSHKKGFPASRIVVDPVLDGDVFCSKPYKDLVEGLRRKSIFVIYPNIQTEDLFFASAAKLSDTVTCMIHRPKFHSIELTGREAARELEMLTAKCFDEFRSACQEIIRQRLYTDSHDGTVSKRVRNGYLTLATRTNKDRIVEEDLVLVKAYNIATNTVYYAGSREPSSDVPCDYVLYSALKSLNSIVHTHCKRLTYCDSLRNFSTRAYVPYGTVELGHEIVDTLRSLKRQDFVLLNAHGEYSLGDRELDDCVNRLTEISSSV